MEESIQSNIGGDDLERIENGEMVEMKDSSIKGKAIDEFANKIF